jgi:hypothetical protein
MQAVSNNFGKLHSEGVLIDSWGIRDGVLQVGLDARTRPGSDEILTKVIGSVGVEISHGEQVAQAD